MGKGERLNFVLKNIMERKSISTRTRFEIFKRDGFICQYCGGHPPKVLLHVDHITPVADGGGNGMDNLITACSQCNLGKSDKSLKDIPVSLKDKAADIAEKEAQIRGYAEVIEARSIRIEEDTWKIVDLLYPPDIYVDKSIKRKDFDSIKFFIQKLETIEVTDAMERALVKCNYHPFYAFKYFCGICWNKIREGGNG